MHQLGLGGAVPGAAGQGTGGGLRVAEPELDGGVRAAAYVPGGRVAIVVVAQDFPAALHFGQRGLVVAGRGQGVARVHGACLHVQVAELQLPGDVVGDRVVFDGFGVFAPPVQVRGELAVHRRPVHVRAVVHAVGDRGRLEGKLPRAHVVAGPAESGDLVGQRVRVLAAVRAVQQQRQADLLLGQFDQPLRVLGVVHAERRGQAVDGGNVQRGVLEAVGGQRLQDFLEQCLRCGGIAGEQAHGEAHLGVEQHRRLPGGLHLLLADRDRRPRMLLRCLDFALVALEVAERLLEHGALLVGFRIQPGEQFAGLLQVGPGGVHLAQLQACATGKQQDVRGRQRIGLQHVRARAARAFVQQLQRGRHSARRGFGGLEHVRQEIPHQHRALGLRLGILGLALGCFRLPQRCSDAAGQAGGQQHAGGHAHPVAGNELAHAVAELRLLRQHRPAVQPAAQVVGQRLGGGVALLRLFGQGLEQHPVQVALQRHVVAVVGVGGVAHQQRGAGGVRALGGSVRSATGEQPVE